MGLSGNGLGRGLLHQLQVKTHDSNINIEEESESCSQEVSLEVKKDQFLLKAIQRANEAGRDSEEVKDWPHPHAQSDSAYFKQRGGKSELTSNNSISN